MRHDQNSCAPRYSVVRFFNILCLVPLLSIVGCKTDASDPLGQCDKDSDRQAILAMQGTFAVSFFFQEIEALDPTYTLQEDAYETAAIEVVKAIEQAENSIVLQHILMIPTEEGEFFPLKHWRQDWTFEDTQVLEYQGDRIWTHRALSPVEIGCSWTQAVSQVDDGPRYEAFGTWQHSDGQSVWESSETYRPLPRRELPRTGEYDVLLASNTHAIDAQGWDHIEDNIKWRLAENSGLVRESGLNRYQLIESDATDVALNYINATGDFWSDVRDVWMELVGDSGSVRILAEYDGFPTYEWLFSAEAQLADASPEERIEALRELMGQFVESL